MTSVRTKKCKKLRNLFCILSSLCWIGTALTITILGFSMVGKETTEILAEGLKDKIVAFGTTAIIGIILALFIKDKIRTTLYMIALIAGTVAKGEVAMYIILGIWALDEYVFYTLYKIYKRKVEINKEIDLR